jgi:hypothetical protein
MRALGLPNTKHFHEITKIADALAREFVFGFDLILANGHLDYQLPNV